MILSIFTRCIPCFYFFKKNNGPTSYQNQAFNPPSNQPLITPELPSIPWNNTVPFVPPITGGQVIKVYDGDTITVAAKLPFSRSPLYRFQIRLRGIDAPEIHGKDEDEQRCAIQVRDVVSNLVLNKYVTLRNTGNEKYGRILADVYLEDFHLNDWLLRERYVVPYDGTTKNPPQSWARYRVTGERT